MQTGLLLPRRSLPGAYRNAQNAREKLDTVRWQHVDGSWDERLRGFGYWTRR